MLSTPYGSETTSTYFYPNINGYAYMTAVVQHPYGESDEDKVYGTAPCNTLQATACSMQPPVQILVGISAAGCLYLSVWHFCWNFSGWLVISFRMAFLFEKMSRWMTAVQG
jgi:hypothetical protein